MTNQIPNISINSEIYGQSAGYGSHYDTSYLTDARLYDKHTVKTIAESLKSIDKCIEYNKSLKHIK